jgi:hypothetical protein
MIGWIVLKFIDFVHGPINKSIVALELSNCVAKTYDSTLGHRISLVMTKLMQDVINSHHYLLHSCSSST